jgi:uncharacterized protein YdaU (DUF1376 family)
MYYDMEKPLVSDVDALCRRLLARSDDEKNAVRVVLDDFFRLQEDGWHNARCDREIANFHRGIDAASRAGKASAEARRNKRSTVVERPLTKRSTNQEPLTNNQEPIKTQSLTLPSWLPAEPWNDYVKHRGSKFTQRAKELALMQLTKMVESGHDPTEILNASVANGWKGLFEPKRSGNGYINRDQERADTIAALTGRPKNQAGRTIIPADDGALWE